MTPLIKLIPICLALAGWPDCDADAQGGLSGREPSTAPASHAQGGERLQRLLGKYPDADINRDGRLTPDEVRAFRTLNVDLQSRATSAVGRPEPDYHNVRYGPHARHVFDLWLPDAAGADAVPVFIHFHGGGFVAGDKTRFNPQPYLEMGYAVMAPNYRFVNGKDVIAPAPMEDGTRALQFLRAHAEQYGIDSRRVALGGGSAGAVIAMWIGFSADMADPASDDPVRRQSTRVRCLVPAAGPTNLDPHWIRARMGGPPGVHPSMPAFFGVADGDYESSTVAALIRNTSVIHHVSADDPPTFLHYRGTLDNLPLPEDAPAGLLVHHPYFGQILKDMLDAAGVECHFHHGDTPAADKIRAFLDQHLAK